VQELITIAETRNAPLRVMLVPILKNLSDQIDVTVTG
jgi:hypothetical protein